MKNKESAFWVVLTAAGKGERFAHDFPKQYLSLLDKTVLAHSLDIFLPKVWVKGIIIVLSKDDKVFEQSPYYQEPKIEVVLGGETRAESVENALRHLERKAHGNDWVLVHDAVRPCLHEEDLNRLVQTLYNEPVGGILAQSVQDTLKFVEKNEIKQTLAREHCWRALTPQMFRLNLLLNALVHCQQQGIKITDDAQAIEAFGLSAKMVPALYPNPKLTLPSDKTYLEVLLQQKQSVGESC